jgi:hypothetical protein
MLCALPEVNHNPGWIPSVFHEGYGPPPGDIRRAAPETGWVNNERRQRLTGHDEKTLRHGGKDLLCTVGLSARASDWTPRRAVKESEGTMPRTSLGRDGC